MEDHYPKYTTKQLKDAVKRKDKEIKAIREKIENLETEEFTKTIIRGKFLESIKVKAKED